MFIFSLSNLFFYFSIFFLIILIVATLPQYRVFHSTPYSGELEKLSAFECGFNMMNKMYKGFSVTFLKVAVLFLLVDLEIALLIPMFNKSSLLLKSPKHLPITVGIISIFLILLLFVEKWSGGLNWKEVGV